MMKLSSTSDYGIRALVDLAQHDGAGPIPSSEIAERQQIPPSLAGQVLGRLRAGGFVESVRGAQGGHQLSRPAGEIRLSSVVEALEGPLAIASCLTGSSVERGGSSAHERCTGAVAQVPLWDAVRAAILEVLESRSVADLAEDAARFAPQGGRYQI